MELLIAACFIDRMSSNLDFQTRIKVDVTTMSCCLYVRRDLQDRLDSHSRPSFGCGSLMGGSAFCLLDAPVIIPFILFKILKYVYKFFTIFNLKGVFPWQLTIKVFQYLLHFNQHKISNIFQVKAAMAASPKGFPANIFGSNEGSYLP